METVIERKVMVNSINDPGNSKPVDSESRLRRSQPKDNQPSIAEASTVNLSETSQQVTALKTLIMTAPEVNHARVTFLKGEILAGRYKIENEQIAQRMYADIQSA